MKNVIISPFICVNFFKRNSKKLFSASLRSQVFFVTAGIFFATVTAYGQAAITGTAKTSEIFSTTFDNVNHSSFTTAVQVPLNTDATGFIKTATDKDYYKFSAEKTETLTITLNNLSADYDIKLYNSLQKQVGVSQNSGTKNETINYTVTAGTYYVYVYGYNKAYNASNAYTLRVSADADSKKTATTDDKSGIKIFPNPAQSVINISADKLAAQSTIKVFDMYGKTVITETAAQNNEVDIRRLNPGSYFIQIEDANENVSYSSRFVKE